MSVLYSPTTHSLGDRTEDRATFYQRYTYNVPLFLFYYRDGFVIGVTAIAVVFEIVFVISVAAVVVSLSIDYL